LPNYNVDCSIVVLQIVSYSSWNKEIDKKKEIKMWGKTK